MRQPTKFNDYKQYLIDKGYNQTASIMTQENHGKLRNFAPTFIRNMAFKNNSTNQGKDFDEFYNFVCKFSHPSFLSMAKNDRFDLQIKEDIEKSTLFVLLESSAIFVDILEKFIDKKQKSSFENTYLEYNKTLDNSS